MGVRSVHPILYCTVITCVHNVPQLLCTNGLKVHPHTDMSLSEYEPTNKIIVLKLLHDMNDN